MYCRNLKKNTPVVLLKEMWRKRDLSQLEECLRCGKANVNRKNLSSKQAVRVTYIIQTQRTGGNSKRPTER